MATRQTRTSSTRPDPLTGLLSRLRLDPAALPRLLLNIATGRTSPTVRRATAAGLAALTVLLLSAGMHPAGAGADVVVAAHDLVAGEVIHSDDVTLRTLGTAPPNGLIQDPATVIGHRVAVPFTAGTPIATTTLIGPALLADPSLVLAPVRLEDSSTLSLLSPGDRIDVLASPNSAPGDASTTPAVVVASNVRVVSAPGPGPAGGSGLFGSTAATGAESRPLLIAVDRPTAGRLAAAATNARLSITIRSQS
jgi:pilus assembly protein CpaB